MLASIVLASLSSARTKGQDAARISDIRAIKTAMELYYNDNNGYPTSNGSSNGDVVINDSVLLSKLVPKYLPSIAAILISDGDHYYSAGYTSGVSPISYSLYVYTSALGYCRTGVNVGAGDWGSPPTCNF